MRTHQATAGRAPLTKAMRLPLPESRVLAPSLENHLALATLRTGHGDEWRVVTRMVGGRLLCTEH